MNKTREIQQESFKTVHTQRRSCPFTEKTTKSIFSCIALHFGIPFFIQRTLGHNYLTPLSQCFRTEHLGEEVHTSYIQYPIHLRKSDLFTQDKLNSVVIGMEPAFLTAKSRTHILFRSRSVTPIHKVTAYFQIQIELLVFMSHPQLSLIRSTFINTLPNSSRGRSAVTDLLKQTSTMLNTDVKDRAHQGLYS